MQGYTKSNNDIMLALLPDPRAYALYMYLLYLSRMDFNIITRKKTRDYTRRKGQYVGSFNDLCGRLNTKYETLKKSVSVLESIGVIECTVQNKSNITINVFENLTTPKNGIVENLTTPKNGIVENLTTPKNGMLTTPFSGIPTTPKNGVLNNNNINKNIINNSVVVEKRPEEIFEKAFDEARQDTDYLQRLAVLNNLTLPDVVEALERMQRNEEAKATYKEHQTKEQVQQHLFNAVAPLCKAISKEQTKQTETKQNTRRYEPKRGIEPATDPSEYDW